VNNTHKTIKLKADCPLAKLSAVDHFDISLITQHVSVSNGEPDFFNEINVPEKFADSVRNLLKTNRDVFAKDDSELSVTDTMEMKIETGDPPPIRSKPYRVPLKNMQAANDAIKQMLHAKIISRCHSSWNSSIVIVDKKDNSKRFCVDFRKLNKITQNTAYPLPRIDDIIAKLGNCQFFTSLDLARAFHQIPMREQDRHKTAFSTPNDGQFCFNRVPFGLSNSPGYFQSLMKIVFKDCDDFAVSYIDDILVCEGHIKHIETGLPKITTT
jgi:hypothetical protein